MIEIFREGDEYAAVDSDVDEIGFGATEAEARLALHANLRDFHRELNDLGPDRLGPHLIRSMEILNQRFGALPDQD